MPKPIKKKYLLVLLVVILILLWLRRSDGASNAHRHYAGAPIVLILAANVHSRGNHKVASYLQKVIENRTKYATQHGYQFVVKDLQKYPRADLKAGAAGWTRLRVLREVLEEYPDSEWIWYLDQDAIIMDTKTSMFDHILDADRLDQLALRDTPIVPPDSVIRTLKATSADSIQFILSQDHQGLNTKSFLLRNGDFAKYLLDTWNEPVMFSTTSPYTANKARCIDLMVSIDTKCQLWSTWYSGTTRYYRRLLYCRKDYWQVTTTPPTI